MSRQPHSSTQTTVQQPDQAVLVPFEAKWKEALCAGKVGVVIRKRIPKNHSVRSLYAYLNRPISAVCFRATISRIFNATIQDLLPLQDKLVLSLDEIKKYVGRSATVGCYVLETIETARVPVEASDLLVRLHVHPPQGFMLLSATQTELLETIAGFTTPCTKVPHPR